MKLRLLFILLLLPLFLGAKAPKKVAAGRGSVVSILTFKGGELLRSGTGVLTGADGELLSTYTLFVDCDSAVTIDPRGKVREVVKISGADENYDCIRAYVVPDKKLVPFAIAARPAFVDSRLYMVAYGAKKSGIIEEAAVEKADTIAGDGRYYTLALPKREKHTSAPLLNEEGELVALLQSVSAGDTLKSHAISANFVKALSMKAATYNSERFARIGIKKALPETEEEALSCLMLQSFSSDSVAYSNMLAEFIAQYPASHQGYLHKAEYAVSRLKDYKGALSGWDKALALAGKKDEVWYHKANCIYAGKLYIDSIAGEAFSIDSAIVCIDRAIEIDRQPLYLRLKGNLHYTKRDYAAAFDCYSALSGTNLCTAETYVLAANCKEILGDSDAAVLQLDSAIATFGRVPVTAMAPYVLNRGLVKYRAGRYREAVLDYNIYENLLNGRVNANFYYMRQQAEYNGKMYRLALADIDMAIGLEPENVLFLLEKGRLCYRVNMIDEALVPLEAAVRLAPDNPDAYYLLARCQMAKGNKTAAKANLEKAQKLGHPSAAETLKSL